MTPTYAGCPPKSFRVNFLPIDVSSMLVIAGVGWHDSLTFTFKDVLHTSTIVNMEACGQNDFSMIFP